MTPKAFHAMLTLILGLALGILWLRTFWDQARESPIAIVAAPFAIAVLGLGHWIAYDFSIRHWAAGFSFIQAVFNVCVAVLLLIRRSQKISVRV